MGELKKVAAINDISGFGRCSLTVAIPVISALGVQVCPFPTAVLSAHTGFEHYSFCDLTPYLENYLKKWQALNLKFNCIYSGFLGSEGQIDLVQSLVKTQEEALVLIDPVMGDEGRVYKTYTNEMCASMAKLCSKAHIITPNLTEACILLGESYPEKDPQKEKIEKMLKGLNSLGAKGICITGIPKGDKLINAALYGGEIALFENMHIDIDINGSGDLFASLICAYTTKGMPLLKAVEKASLWVTKAIEYTRQQNQNPEHGIMFEPLLASIGDELV